MAFPSNSELLQLIKARFSEKNSLILKLKDEINLSLKEKEFLLQEIEERDKLISIIRQALET